MRQSHIRSFALGLYGGNLNKPNIYHTRIFRTSHLYNQPLFVFPLMPIDAYFYLPVPLQILAFCIYVDRRFSFPYFAGIGLFNLPPLQFFFTTHCSPNSLPY